MAFARQLRGPSARAALLTTGGALAIDVAALAAPRLAGPRPPASCRRLSGVQGPRLCVSPRDATNLRFSSNISDSID
jgi:hypothetical protein